MNRTQRIETDATLKFGLIGYPVSHSLSPAIFQAAFRAAGVDARYDLYPVAPGDLEHTVSQLASSGLRGFNVTVPHKLAVVPLMKELDDSAVLTGAVNTVQVTPEGLVGHNTDMGGFGDSLAHFGVRELKGSKVLVLGAGGAARAVVASLGRSGAGTVVIANKFLEETTDLLSLLAPSLKGVRFEAVSLADGELAGLSSGAVLCVQATSLGLKEGDPLPIDPSILPDGCFVYDLVYGPGETPFVRSARDRGLSAADGKEMLLRQAARNYALWLGAEPPVEAMRLGLEGALKGKE